VRLRAHRGSHGRAGPLENTLRAFAKAIADGADGIELDVHVSADGVPLVFHDDDLARLTDGRDPRRLAALTAAEIRAVPLRGGAHIPSLGEVLDLVARRVPVNVELKDAAAVEPVAALLLGRPVAADILLSSFDADAIRAAMGRMPGIPRAIVAGTRTLDARVRLREALPQRLLTEVRAHAWHPNVRLVRRGLVEALRRRGVQVNVWTINDRATARRLLRAGVEGVFTDNLASLSRLSATTRESVR